MTLETKHSPRGSFEFLTFGKPDIGQPEIDAVAGVLRSGWLSTGPVTREFEEEFDHSLAAGHAVAVSSCTEALMLSLLVAGIKPDDEVIVPPMTFCATVNAILQIGAKPVFVDVTESGHINPVLISLAITKKTMAIVPVHYTGAPCEMDEIMRIARRNTLIVVEDAAHSFGGTYETERFGRTWQGTIGHLGCFSFYATKNITCAEGGMIVTKDSAMAEKLRAWRLQGMSAEAWRRYGNGRPQYYTVEFPGHKGNLSDVHAAIGLAQLRRWPAIKAKRDAIWRVYEEAFGPKEPGHSRHLFTIRHPKRDALRDFLYSKGIGTGIHFKALHLEPGYVLLGYQEGNFPVAENISRETLSLPISGIMTEDDAAMVVEAVREFNESV